MARLLTRIGRALRLPDDRSTVHLHASTFWRDEQPEVCFDPDCSRPRLNLD